MSHKPLFSRALSLNPGRLHFAAHSHHLWPDASLEGQTRAWEDANRHADRKWDLAFGEVVPEAQSHVARELNLPDPNTVVFASNTHDFLVRLASGIERRPVRILTTDGEFHSLRRQAARWIEAGQAEMTVVPVDPLETLAERLIERAQDQAFDLVIASQVFFRTGRLFADFARLAALSRPEGPWVVIDGYHGFMATPTDLGPVADRVFYMAGGYKYAMTGEGAGFLHAPPGFCERPVVTGWFAEFGDLSGPPGGVEYRSDAGRFWGATFDPSALYRFNHVRRMLAAQGLDTAAVADHARGLQRRFQAAVADGRAGPLSTATPLNPVRDDGPRARFLALRHPRAADWRAALMARDIVTDVREDVIRFGFGLYQDAEDVERLIAACAEMD